MEYINERRSGQAGPTTHTVWHEFTNVIEILNVPFEKRLTDHISNLEENPDLILVKTLPQLCEENQPLVKVLCDLSGRVCTVFFQSTT